MRFAEDVGSVVRHDVSAMAAQSAVMALWDDISVGVLPNMLEV